MFELVRQHKLRQRNKKRKKEWEKKRSGNSNKWVSIEKCFSHFTFRSANFTSVFISFVFVTIEKKMCAAHIYAILHNFVVIANEFEMNTELSLGRRMQQKNQKKTDRSTMNCMASIENNRWLIHHFPQSIQMIYWHFSSSIYFSVFIYRTNCFHNKLSNGPEMKCFYIHTRV